MPTARLAGGVELDRDGDQAEGDGAGCDGAGAHRRLLERIRSLARAAQRPVHRASASSAVPALAPAPRRIIRPRRGVATSTRTAPSAPPAARPSPSARRASRRARCASWCSSTRRAGCTRTCAWSGTACCSPGRCRRGPPRPQGQAAGGRRPRTIRSSTRTSRASSPKGEYGGGAMIVWDRGQLAAARATRRRVWRGASSSSSCAATSCAAPGRWSSSRRSRASWLLIKERDAWARAGDGGPGALDPRSVLSGLTVEELGAGAQRAAELRRAARRLRSARAPGRVDGAQAAKPMLAEVARPAVLAPRLDLRAQVRRLPGAGGEARRRGGRERRRGRGAAGGARLSQRPRRHAHLPRAGARGGGAARRVG